MIINKSNPVQIDLANETINTVRSMKILGVWVDWNLRWVTQVEKSIKKARSLGFALRYLNRHLSRDQMKRVFMSHFVSRLMYGCPIWGLSITYNQRAALRSVYYKQIRLILRDFKLKLNRDSL